MAKRPVFVPIAKAEHLVDEIDVEFGWNPGFARIQKVRNVVAMHSAAERKGLFPLLEVSTKSEIPLGQRLSAFSLQIDTPIGKISIESAYQGSKVFELGGPFVDIYSKDSREAKKDARLATSGKLISFNFFGQKWPLIPKTAFYDWLYLSALSPHKDFLTRLFVYKGFTDIEFNPDKSLNCQARTCALLVSLMHLGILERALGSQSEFIETVGSDSLMKNHSADLRQGTLPSTD